MDLILTKKWEKKKKKYDIGMERDVFLPPQWTHVITGRYAADSNDLEFELFEYDCNT